LKKQNPSWCDPHGSAGARGRVDTRTRDDDDDGDDDDDDEGCEG
jgi:hypothetical protein